MLIVNENSVIMAIVYDKCVIEVPTYLDLNFFQEATEYALQYANPEIEKIEISMGSNTGDNYCSFIYRTKIYYIFNINNNITNNQHDKLENTKSLTLIIKSMPITKSIDFLVDMKVFLKEKIFYLNVLPLMELHLDNGRKFGAKLYHCIKYPINTFVFEDLTKLGYRVASRELGFNEEHAKLTVQRLAEFHAISIILNEKDPNFKKSFDCGLLAKGALCRENSNLFLLCKVTFDALIELSRSLKGYEHITKKLENYAITLKSRLIKSQTPEEGEFRVLNHGDMWVNNMLFSYDKHGHPKDIVFVDYQMAIWGSPGIDLNYLFYTSLPLSILRTKRDYFIKIYHEKLIEVLKRFNYSILPTYQQIKDEVFKRAAYGFFANHTIFPLISMDKSLSYDSTFENLTNPEFAKQKFRQVFGQERLKELYAYTLQEFYNMNVYD